MKKFLIVFFSLVGLTAFSGLAGQASEKLEVESDSRTWNVSMNGHSSIRAYNQEAQVEIVINVAPLLPTSPMCMVNKRIKDIKFTLNIYKVADAGESDWAKSFEKMRIRFYRPGASEERKVYGSNLIKNNQRFAQGTVINVGSLEFLSPFTCEDFYNTTMRLTSMRANGRPLPDLEFTIDKKS